MRKLSKALREKHSPEINDTHSQPGNATSSSPPPAYTEVVEDVYKERQRTEGRHKEASEQLKAALKVARGTWKGFQASENTISENLDPTQIRQGISEFFASHEKVVKSKSRWAKCKKVIEKVYTSISPFLKNLLIIATQGSAVADREIDREAEIEAQLDYISRQLGQLEVTEELPNAGVPSHHLIDCAMEVHSAVMIYLAILIRYESRVGGVMGKVVTAFAKGTEDRESATAGLGNAIQNFNDAFSVYAHRVNLKTFTIVQDIKNQLLSPVSVGPTPVSPIINRFLVPYDENPHFVGRKELLKNIRAKLSEVVPKHYNHRVALHGLGGVGKTQTALAYIYAHQLDYNAVYWITGVNQASLLSGFQDIAKASGLLHGTHEMEQTDVAKMVLEWFRGQDNWLLVIDNLDDFEVAEHYLPPRDVKKHTIITTRNPHFNEIPAEGIEIGILDRKDAIELLVLRSRLPSKFDPEKVEAEACEIVEKLGFLALAIEQAAAFIRETSKDIFRFLPSYAADRKKHHKRAPRGNWEYSNVVATTWRLSCQKVKDDNAVASELLQLFSFLNPDGILGEFLEAGREGLPSSLRDLIGDPDEFYGALNDLERSSLIRRQDDEDEEMITMHRLVQAVIKDDMEDKQFSLMTEHVLSLCDQAFPHTWEGETRAICRKYQEQVLVTLSEVKETKSDVLLRLLIRVALFLQEDGKYAQAIELETKIIAVSTARNGADHQDTLKAMARLATAYRSQKRFQDAIEWQEKVYATTRAKLGDEHLDTWAAMGDLAAAYRSGGRRQNAAEMQEKVLKARTQLLGSDHPETMRAMGNLGATYRNQRRYDEATFYQKKVFEWRMETMGEDNPETLRAALNLAVTYRHSQQPNLAAPLEERVVAYRLKYWGVEHPETLLAVQNLAKTYTFLKRWDDAYLLQETVVGTRKKVFGEEAIDTIWAMSTLSDIYRKQGKLEEAMKLLERVLELRSKVLGYMHHDTIAAMEKLSMSYESLGRIEDARKLKEESKLARKTILPVQRSRNLVPAAGW